MRELWIEKENRNPGKRKLERMTDGTVSILNRKRHIRQECYTRLEEGERSFQIGSYTKPTPDWVERMVEQDGG